MIVALQIYPDRYSDKRGRVMWVRVMKLIEVAEMTRGHEAEAA